MDKHGLKRLHGVVKQSMRLNYYPRCSKPDLVLGVSPHSDGGSITFLLQDDDITGLQIKYTERWIPVKPIPNAFVVNVGDIIEVFTVYSKDFVLERFYVKSFPFVWMKKICKFYHGFSGLEQWGLQKH